MRWQFFTIFCLLFKIKFKVLAYSLKNYLLILKILHVTRFKGPKSVILTLKMLTGSRLWFCNLSKANTLQPQFPMCLYYYYYYYYYYRYTHAGITKFFTYCIKETITYSIAREVTGQTCFHVSCTHGMEHLFVIHFVHCC
jgi:hypothetical protein